MDEPKSRSVLRREAAMRGEEPPEFVESGVCYCGLPMDEHNVLSGCNTPRDNPIPVGLKGDRDDDGV